MGDVEIHRPVDLLLSASPSPTRALLILNQPIASFDLLDRLWHSCDYRICADGGANRLFDLFADSSEGFRANYLPDLIHGDLDSINPEVRLWYAAHSVPVERDPDQYSTDFGKCMKKITSRAQTEDVVILGSISGRVDQGLGLLSEIAREQARHPKLCLWLASEISLTWLLKGPSASSMMKPDSPQPPPSAQSSESDERQNSPSSSQSYAPMGKHSGRHRIEGLQASGAFKENVGIIPVYGPAHISTTGLEWDVTDWPTEMAGAVSTSNHVRADVVHIQTDRQVLFTVERADILPDMR